MPPEAIAWFLAEQYGWSLEYVESLTLRQLAVRAAVEEAKEKLRQWEADKARRKRGRRW